MCPMCWAAALASFAALLVISVLIVAGNDLACLGAALTLGVIVMLQRLEWFAPPAWCIFTVGGLAIGRLAYLLAARRNEILIGKLWRRACRYAGSRCPNKTRLPADATTRGA